MQQSRSLKIFNIIGYFLLLIGGIGWFSGAAATLGFDPSFEMPLGQLEGVAVDSSGNIYCGLQFHSRVQKYDPDGNYLLGFQIDGSKPTFRIRVNENDELELVNFQKFFRYSPKGKLIEEKICITDIYEVNTVYEEFGKESEKQCQGPDNATYKIRMQLLFPAVVKTSASGEKTTVVSVPIYLWLLMGPFPAFIIALIGLLPLGYCQVIKEEDKRNLKRSLKTNPSPKI